MEIKEKVNFIMSMLHNWESVDFFECCADCTVTMMKKGRSRSVFPLKVYAFNKKAVLISQRYFDDFRQLSFDEKFWGSYFVVFFSSRYTRVQVLARLWKACLNRRCYGAISFSKNGDLLFFPKSTYQDSNLLSFIIKEHLDEAERHTVYPARKKLVA